MHKKNKKKKSNSDSELHKILQESESKNIKFDKTLVVIEPLKEYMYEVFNIIFSDKNYKDINNKIYKITNYNQFKEYCLVLNSQYIEKNNKDNDISIIKINQNKPTQLYKLCQNDETLTISPNGIFAKTSKIGNYSTFQEDHYNNIIADSLIIDGNFYFEIKILELGDNTDMFIGFIRYDSQIKVNENYRHFPINYFNENENEKNEKQFVDGCCLDLNEKIIYDKKYNIINKNEDELHNNKKEKFIQRGDVITVEIDFIKNKVKFYINGNLVLKENDSMYKGPNIAYQPAISLSSNKEIQINFGGVYQEKHKLKKISMIDKKQSNKNNLEKIVKIYINIIKKDILKIINHEQIQLIDSLYFFEPIFNFFGQVVLKDEHIVKQYIFKFLYSDNIRTNEDKINDNPSYIMNYNYTFLELVILRLNREEQEKTIIFLLNCLSEDIKYLANNCKINIEWSKNVSLYNFLLNKNLIKDLLFGERCNINKINTNKKIIRMQLHLIFQPFFCVTLDYKDILKEVVDKKEKIEEINGSKKNYIDKLFEFYKRSILEHLEEIDFKIIIQVFTELINTLLDFEIKNKNENLNEIEILLNNNKKNNNSINNKINNEIEKNKGLLYEDNFKEKLRIKTDIFKSKYRDIFFDFIFDLYNINIQSGIFNFIITILFPLLNLYNNTIKYEKFSNLINDNILNVIPFFQRHENKFLKCNLGCFLSKNVNRNLFNEKIKNKNILLEIKRKYNFSSFLNELIINLISLFSESLSRLFKYNKLKKKLVKQIKDHGMDGDTSNMFIFEIISLFLNENYSNILTTALNNLIPFILKNIENNFYLFLPVKFMKGLQFFILYFFNFYEIEEYYNIFINNSNYTLNQDLLILYIKLINIKLSYKDIREENFIGDDIMGLYNLFDFLKKSSKKNELIKFFYKKEDFEKFFDYINDYHLKRKELSKYRYDFEYYCNKLIIEILISMKIIT